MEPWGWNCWSKECEMVGVYKIYSSNNKIKIKIFDLTLPVFENMKKILRVELEIDDKVIDWSEYAIKKNTTEIDLIKQFIEFLEETY